MIGKNKNIKLLVGLGIVAILMTTSVVYAQIPQNDVIVDVTPDSQTGLPGDTLTYTVNLTNNGTVDDIIMVDSITGVPPGWTFELKDAGVPQPLPYFTPLLQDKTSYLLTLDVHIPVDATAGATMTINISSLADISKTDSDTFEIMIDVTPPSPVSNLNETAKGLTWILWNWTNPPEGDFNHIEVWRDGVFKINTSGSSYNATGLSPGTTYEIGTRTVDNAGNINQTWVNDSAATLPIVTPTPTTPPARRGGGAKDSDRDGHSDGYEKRMGTDPNDPNSYPGAPTPTPTPTLTPHLTPSPTPIVTPTPVVTPTPSPTPSPTPTPPGFEAFFAITAGILAAAYLVLRRKK